MIVRHPTVRLATLLASDLEPPQAVRVPQAETKRDPRVFFVAVLAPPAHHPGRRGRRHQNPRSLSRVFLTGSTWQAKLQSNPWFAVRAQTVRFPWGPRTSCLRSASGTKNGVFTAQVPSARKSPSVATCAPVRTTPNPT